MDEKYRRRKENQESAAFEFCRKLDKDGLYHHLYANNPKIRYAAAGWLMFGSSENTPLYDDTLAVAYRMLREANFKARDTACYLLGQLKTTESEIPLIMQQLDDVAANDPTATVRASAITALGHRCIGLTEYWPLLANRCHFAFNSPYVGIRFSVSFAIGCLCDDSLLPPLIALLHDTDDDVRDWAAFAINQQGYNSAELRAILTIMLNDRHEGVRTEAEIWFEEHEERPFLQNTTAS